jgi:hypothetical protein
LIQLCGIEDLKRNQCLIFKMFFIQVDPDDPLGLNRIRNSFLDQPRVGSGAGSRNGNGGGDSPESTSLYSDEIPSGYNSGEQVKQSYFIRL